MSTATATLNVWPAQAAKNHFSDFLQAAINQGPQLVTKRGVEAAVLVPIAQWEQWKHWEQRQAKKPSLKNVLLEKQGQGDLYIPPRQSAAMREPLEW